MTPIETLIAERPTFHAWPDGEPANWAVPPAVLRFIHSRVAPGMHTLETGAGQTTVAFLLAGARHVSITPDRAQTDRIRAYCAEHGIANAATFIHDSSDAVLPVGRDIPETLDFVLIDGAHRFPFPIIDWHYTAHRVPVGGVVAVDDCIMPSVRILHDFLMGEDEWVLIREIGVTSFFERTRETVNAWDWADQKINAPHVERWARRSGAAAEPRGVARLFNRWARPRDARRLTERIFGNRKRDT